MLACQGTSVAQGPKKAIMQGRPMRRFGTPKLPPAIKVQQSKYQVTVKRQMWARCNGCTGQNINSQPFMHWRDRFVLVAEAQGRDKEEDCGHNREGQSGAQLSSSLYYTTPHTAPLLLSTPELQRTTGQHRSLAKLHALLRLLLLALRDLHPLAAP
jgi:hypothetical protein